MLSPRKIVMPLLKIRFRPSNFPPPFPASLLTQTCGGRRTAKSVKLHSSRPRHPPPHKKRRKKMQLHSAEENSALHIPNFPLHPKLPDLLCQPLDAVFVFPRQIVDFLHGIVNLLYSRRHFVHRILDNRRQLV